MKNLSTLVVTSTMSVILLGCGANQKEIQLQGFIATHVDRVKPMHIEANLAYWDAAVSGKAEDYEKVSELTLKIRQVYSDPDDFAFLKELRESDKTNKPILTRQLDMLHNAYLPNQIEPELLKKLVDLGTEIEKNFSTFRGTIDGEKVTDNEIKEILKDQTDSAKRRQAWLASKQVGSAVADDIIRLVKLRNQAAHKLGFENFHTMSLTTSEQNVEELDRIFDELYELTNEPFAALKADLDRILAAKYGVAENELMPWHYHDPFFQETPMVYELDLDGY
ncbi:MAG: M2 family metallopeptidase [Planctomycetota bacterium]